MLLIFWMVQAALGTVAQTREPGAALSPAEFECLYEYRVTHPTSATDVSTTILQIGRDGSCFMDYTAYQADSVGASPDASDDELKKYRMRVAKNSLYFDQTVLQNYPQGEITVYSVIPPDHYVYREKLHPIRWTLDAETATVCGYLCKRATGEYGGRKWIVWYAPEIPASFGPWKFGGLPGLVMRACDTERIHCFEAITFRKGTLPIALPDVPHPVTVERERFIRSKNRFEADPMGNIPLESISDVVVQKGVDGSNTILVNGVQLRLRPNGYIPLELE